MTRALSRTGAYWACQLVGWGGLAACSSLFRLLTNEFSNRGLRADLLASLAGLLVTHALRSMIRSHSWLDLPGPSLAARVIVGSGSVGLTLAVVTITLSPEPRHPASSHAFLWLCLIGSLLGLAWIALYLGVHFFERSLQERTRALESESAARDMEIALLKSQMDPHFVYNSLNVIRALIGEDPGVARAAVSHLSGLMRATTSMSSASFVAINEELDMVGDYLALQKLRFEERLRYEVECDDNLVHTPIPPLTIQSLVENGVKHGISSQRDGGFIEVRIQEHGSSISIRVESSGKWLESDRAGGLANLEKRLRLVYRGKADLTVDHKGPERSVVEVRLPTQPEEQRRGTIS